MGPYGRRLAQGAEAFTDGKRMSSRNSLFYPSCPGAERAEAISDRIRDKISDYSSYEFTKPQTRALNIYFDLAQEFESEKDFLAICVMVPKLIFGLDCSLYLVNRDLHMEGKACTSGDAVPPDMVWPDAPVLQRPDRHEGHWYFPIRANPRHLESLPFAPPGAVIGCLEVYPAARMQAGDSLFWEKFANRIGFQMHNRMMRDANRRHLRFIRSLAKDIGHNVIVPNMYFKLFFNRLKRSIDGISVLERRMAAAGSAHRGEIVELHRELSDRFEEIAGHYEQTSLYLETLLRQSHFEKGHYVLERRECDVARQIIDPQLHHFMSRFEEKGIEVAGCPGGDGDGDSFVLQVDVGLMAQVYANLFSNALKYTASPANGGTKRLACSMARDPDGLGPGRCGVRFGLFTTGKTIPAGEGDRLFEAGVRGQGGETADGSGHGLFFVRQIVEMHGGTVGHEPKPDGNEFHMTLPCETKEGDTGSAQSRGDGL